ncbi:MAG TPA: hypothetical protein VFN07_00465 [Trueperaceae bacterium]|nr:hypothetical protein [Trueperaceae bacterium]
MKQPAAAWRRLLRAVATPQVLVACLLLVAALSQLRSPAWRPEQEPSIAIDRANPPLPEQEVRLVIVDESGLERSRTVRVAVPEGASQRLSVVLGALRAELVQVGVWPSDLPAPRVFVDTLERQRVAVIDMLVPQPVGVSVGQELAMLRSLTATAEANGAERVRYLRDGQPTTTLLDHVAVPASL